MKKQAFLNTYINNLTMQETVETVENLILEGHRSYLVEINVDVVIKMEQDQRLRSIVDNADLTLLDGKPLVWISRLKKMPVKEKISGSDLVPRLCEMAAEKGYSIFILGGKDGVARKAEENLKKRYPGIWCAGTYSPPLGFEKDEEELAHIRALLNQAKPDLLFVCFGCPKQEKWIADNYQLYDAKVSVCSGATVDFLAGTVKRAPKWMSECGLEWFYRFLMEPKRLFRRYFIDDMKIVKLIWTYR
jgi:N-acetylglucosaminyldiphosphoundecaprenol N-acetyl-beta-D-mannosaminyltransferase